MWNRIKIWIGSPVAVITFVANVLSLPKNWGIIEIHAPAFYQDYHLKYVFIILSAVYLMWVVYPILIKLIASAYSRLQTIKFTDDSHSIHCFGYIISRPYNLCLVGDINLRMLNNKNKPLLIKNAYLKSLITGNTILGVIDGHKAQNLQLNAKKEARIYFKFPNESGYLANEQIKGITLEKFEKEFSNFEVVIETDRKSFKFNYDTETTRGWVVTVEMGLMRPAPSEKPAVIPLGIFSQIS